MNPLPTSPPPPSAAAPAPSSPSSGTPVTHHLELGLGHHLVIADAGLVDHVARQRLVLRRRVGKSVKGSWVARSDSQAMSSMGSPRCGQLPVDDCRHPAVEVHEVPWPRIPLHQHGRPVVGRDVVPEPAQREGEGRIGRPASRRQHALPLVELGQHGLATVVTVGKAGRSSAEASRACSAASLVMKSRAVASCSPGSVMPGEPGPALHPFRQHGLVHGMHARARVAPAPALSCSARYTVASRCNVHGSFVRAGSERS